MQEQTAPDQPETAASPRHRGSALALLSLAIVVYATDQLTKNWVVANLPEGRSVPVLGEFLQWYFVRNPGAAFSMASGATWVFTLLAAVVVGAIIWQVRHLGSRTWAIFFALLLGGVLGNLTDRLTRDPGFPVGHVIDFISTPWMFPWPLSPAIYNVADIGIVSAMCLFVLITILGLPIDGSPRSRGGKNGGDAEAIESEATDTDSTEEDPA